FFAVLQDEDLHRFARQHDRLQRIRQFVDIEHLHAVQLCHLIQVEIVGHDLAFIKFAELDQLHIHFAHRWEIVFHDLYRQGGDLLHALQDVEATTSTIALQGIGGVSDELQLAQNERRNHKDAVEETGLRDISDASVDDDAG